MKRATMIFLTGFLGLFAFSQTAFGAPPFSAHLGESMAKVKGCAGTWEKVESSSGDDYSMYLCIKFAGPDVFDGQPAMMVVMDASKEVISITGLLMPDPKRPVEAQKTQLLKSLQAKKACTVDYQAADQKYYIFSCSDGSAVSLMLTPLGDEKKRLSLMLSYFKTSAVGKLGLCDTLDKDAAEEVSICK